MIISQLIVLLFISQKLGVQLKHFYLSSSNKFAKAGYIGQR